LLRAAGETAPDLPVIIVSGLPRTGTSMMMQVLSAGGMPLATDGARRADRHNPRGYFELEAVKRLRTRDDPPDPGAWRGMAVKMVHLLLYHLPVAACSYRVIAMRRELREVAASQQAMLAGREGRARGSEAEVVALFRREMERLDAWLRLRPDIAALHVDYNEVIRNPRAEAEAVARFLSLGLDVNRMAEAVDAALYRRRL